MRRTPAIALLGGLMTAALATSAIAQTPHTAVSGTSDIWRRSQLTVDWGGWRTQLADHGVIFTGTELLESVHNFNGGVRNETRAAGQLWLGATIDTEKAWGGPGGKLQITLTQRHGNSLTNDAGLDLLQAVQTLYGRGEIWRLSQFWYEQTVNGGATQVKLGRLTHGEDFGASPCGNVSNFTLCGAASSQVVSGYLYNIPVSAWGVRLRQRITPRLHANLEIMESNPVNLREDHGFYLGTAGATGVIYAGELQWTPTLGSSGDLPGTYKIGGWYDTSDSDNVVTDAGGGRQAVTGLPFARENHHSGIHANMLQQLVAPRADGSHELSVAANLALVDLRTNRLGGKAAVIFSRTGLFAGRARDDLTFGVGAVFMNPRVTDLQQAQRDAGLRADAAQDIQYSAELNYGYRLTPAITLRPGLQFIHNPGGRSDRDDIFVGGLKLSLAL